MVAHDQKLDYGLSDEFIEGDMKYDFDKIIDRKYTHSSKWDGMAAADGKLFFATGQQIIR